MNWFIELPKWAKIIFVLLIPIIFLFGTPIGKCGDDNHDENS
jgi:hypothetical protein